jgi:hypothetical protein
MDRDTSAANSLSRSVIILTIVACVRSSIFVLQAISAKIATSSTNLKYRRYNRKNEKNV